MGKKKNKTNPSILIFLWLLLWFDGGNSFVYLFIICMYYIIYVRNIHIKQQHCYIIYICLKPINYQFFPIVHTHKYTRSLSNHSTTIRISSRTALKLTYTPATAIRTTEPVPHNRQQEVLWRQQVHNTHTYLYTHTHI